MNSKVFFFLGLIFTSSVLGIKPVKPRQIVEPRQIVKPRQIIKPRSSSCASVPSFLSSTRIVGGSDAESMLPWQVSVRQTESGDGHFCGGTILDSTTILSAAHCFTSGQDMSGYYIMAGSTSRSSGGQTIEIANGVWNTDMVYDSTTMNNDIVILKLSSALTLGDDVQAACLPESTYDPVGESCFVSGWGTLESGGETLPATLQWVDVPILTNDKCMESYGTSITDQMICAGYDEGGKDSCQGDSGGPLVCSNDGSAVITGVVSFGAGCADAGYPGVYARVTQFLEWINANMGGDTTDDNGGDTTDDSNDDDGTVTYVCYEPTWWADGACDDENNTEECGYDGGDCCDDDASHVWCSVCACLEP